MEKLVERGLCKAIGISNFTIKKTNTLLETAKIIPACNQGTYTSYRTLEHVWQRHTAFQGPRPNVELFMSVYEKFDVYPSASDG